MPTIHLIKKRIAGLPAILPVKGENNVYTSGYWTLSEARAQTLIGCPIYFHERQSEPSYYGGTLLTFVKSDGWRIQGPHHVQVPILT
jgi:hypothetical protein